MARPFYGWYVVAAAFAVTWVGFGSAYTFSAFLDSLQRDFAACARRVIVIGMLLVGLGLCAAGMARTLTQVYAAYGLGVGLGVGFSYVPALDTVQRWFIKRRGFAWRAPAWRC